MFEIITLDNYDSNNYDVELKTDRFNDYVMRALVQEIYSRFNLSYKKALVQINVFDAPKESIGVVKIKMLLNITPLGFNYLFGPNFEQDDHFIYIYEDDYGSDKLLKQFKSCSEYYFEPVEFSFSEINKKD